MLFRLRALCINLGYGAYRVLGLRVEDRKRYICEGQTKEQNIRQNGHTIVVVTIYTLF